MNEFSLLSRVFENNAALPAGVFLPPGDDMAGVRISGKSLLSAVDSVVEGVHFRLDPTTLCQVGRKAITRNLSDVAAMAAIPVASLVAVVLPGKMTEEHALELFQGMQETAREYNCPLIGGDISMHDGPLVCCVTVLAQPGPGGVITRSGAQVGDHVYVTDQLGGSLKPDGSGKHLTFEPRIDLALKLVRNAKINAMIDISDGLGIDAGHIAAQSRVRIVLQEDAIPCTPGRDFNHAMRDGEDYELLFTAGRDRSIPDSISDVRITKIGKVEEGTGTVGIQVGKAIIDMTQLGWEHHG